MKTKKLNAVLICVLAFLVISINSFAQNKEIKTKKTPEEKAKITSEKLKSSLNLSDDQSSRIYELNLQRIKDHKEFKENKSKLSADRKKKSSEYKNSLKNILSDEQFKSLKKMKKEKNFKKIHRNKLPHKMRR